MRRVRVEEAAAVRAQILDGDLRSGRTDGENLVDYGLSVSVLRGLEKRNGAVRAERLDDSLRDEKDGKNERERQQDVERRPDQIDPEVADPVRLPSADGRE